MTIAPYSPSNYRPYLPVALPNGGIIQTLFLYETETSVFTRYGCFHKPDLTYARDPAVRLLVDSQIPS
jgi:hypothetical protein